MNDDIYFQTQYQDRNPMAKSYISHIVNGNTIVLLAEFAVLTQVVRCSADLCRVTTSGLVPPLGTEVPSIQTEVPLVDWLHHYLVQRSHQLIPRCHQWTGCTTTWYRGPINLYRGTTSGLVVPPLGTEVLPTYTEVLPVDWSYHHLAQKSH